MPEDFLPKDLSRPLVLANCVRRDKPICRPSRQIEEIEICLLANEKGHSERSEESRDRERLSISRSSLRSK